MGNACDGGGPYHYRQLAARKLVASVSESEERDVRESSSVLVVAAALTTPLPAAVVHGQIPSLVVAHVVAQEEAGRLHLRKRLDDGAG
jgi:hypothetical protein